MQLYIRFDIQVHIHLVRFGKERSGRKLGSDLPHISDEQKPTLPELANTRKAHYEMLQVCS